MNRENTSWCGEMTGCKLETTAQGYQLTDSEAMFFALSYNVDGVFNVRFVVLSTFACQCLRTVPEATHGPACSRASQVTSNLNVVKPHELNLVRCTW
jgi:hypothetical protein